MNTFPKTSSKTYLLTLNAGSSSIKFSVFTVDAELRCILSGSLDRVRLCSTGPGSTLAVHDYEHGTDDSHQERIPDNAEAAQVLLSWIEQRVGAGKLLAVGHRLVHGGAHYHEPQIIDAAMLKQLRELVAFDPQHMPAVLELIDGITREQPGLCQVACFDTAFHHDMPVVSRLLPIPRRYFEKGVHRYGFHGLSYQYLMEALQQVAAGEAGGRVILAHLGNGASLAAVREGKPVDTSMGFTPAAGLPMGSRSGDLDPGLMGYLARTEGMSPGDFNHMVNFQSGLLGISGTSADMRDLLALEATDIRAAQAVAVFCYQIKKSIGAYAAALGGLDTLVFSGGIGAQSPVIRARICQGLEFLGLRLDNPQNEIDATVISTASSTVSIRVIPTNEELVIARATTSVLSSHPQQYGNAT